MKDRTMDQVDEIRRHNSDWQNHVIDEYRSGRISRREFVRRGAVAGISLSAVNFLAAACGSGDTTDTSSGGDQANANVKPGGTIKAGINATSGALDPLTVKDQGGLAVLGQSGEYLVWSDRNLKPIPRLAESWEPNKDGSVWTFKIRQGVKFHDGTPMTARDVAATFNRLADPDNSSNALSTFTGVLSKGGTSAVDDATVRFELDNPTGSFPYITSSDNYNAIILPRNYDGDWEKTFIGTGPWKKEKFTPNVGVIYTKNPDYWDKSRQPNADRAEIRWYGKEQAAVLGLQGGEVDLLGQFSVTGGKSLLTDSNVKVVQLRSAAHRQVHMRGDKEPFEDKRVRQAMALLVNRAGIVDGLFEKRADLGNDHPFAPVYPSGEKGTPAQRKQDVAKAKQLLAAAGKPNGFSVQIDGWDGFEMPDLAQLIQNDVKDAGINIRLNFTDNASYYGDGVYGKSRWLDSTMGITEYGHRGIPNVYLGAPLKSDGTWNGAHFKNKEYDGLVDDYTSALDIQSQRAAAEKIQTLLNDEVPIMFLYFYYYLSATKPNVGGYDISAMGHVDLQAAGFSS